ncbi:MAG TPA: COX15/CtaA family protein [Acetobacteraceae bacterium]|nr:COX15/CtaA family protein [Acetobacteraceae bacterium]
MITMPFELSDLPAARASDEEHNRRLLAGWLFLLAGMILVMVALGGATRLTGSGLSIMRWAPLDGILPPLSHADWERLYALYRAIPQYALVNRGFGLAGFQHIFWLEWVHRLWGRLIGVAVIVPLAWFWWRGRLVPGLGPRLLLFFVLGGLQGVLGWMMVSTGFRPDSTAVAAPWLVAHLCLALTLYAAILWTGLSVLTPRPAPIDGARPLFRLALVLVALVAVTIAAGGLVAGTHAGFIYNTFPLMEGRLIPPGYGALRPFLANLIRNVAAVQFDHRVLATLTALTTLAAMLLAFRTGLPPGARRAFAALGFVVVLQYSLGVATLLAVVPIGLAVAHQVTATLLLTAALVALHSLRGAALAPR